MDSKLKDCHRLKVLNEVGSLPKTKMKVKARKELWDSFFAIYENEVNKGDLSDIEVSELDKNTNISSRALKQMSTTNPQLLFAAGIQVVEDAAPTLGEEVQKEEEARGKKRKRETKTSKTCNLSCYMKTKNRFSSIKKCRKSIMLLDSENSLKTLKKRKKEDKKLISKNKLQDNSLKDKDTKTCVKGIETAQRRTNPKYGIESFADPSFSKNLKESNNVQVLDKKDRTPGHKCQLEYRYYMDTENISARADKRSFNCKLIFKNLAEASEKLQKIQNTNEQAIDPRTDQSKHSKYNLKSKKKSKSKHLRRNFVNENNEIDCDTVYEKDKEKTKPKDLASRRNTFKISEIDNSHKDKDNLDTSVIVLHKYRKGIVNKQNDSHAEETIKHKPCYKPEKISKKSKEEDKPNTQENSCLQYKPSCENLKHDKLLFDEKSGLDFEQQFKDKHRKKREKGTVYKTLSTSLESKLKKKRRKCEKQQILKEVANALGTNEDVYNKIKNLPIKIDKNQLIFMHPSHLAKALEHCTPSNKHRDEISVDNISNESNETSLNITNKKKKNAKLSLVKLDKHAKSKRLRVLTSLKKIKPSKTGMLEEKSDTSLRKVPKHRKEHKKRSKLSPVEKNKSVQDLNNVKGVSKSSHKTKFENNILQKENDSEKFSAVLGQNICCGDNDIGSIINNISSQNNKLSTIYSSSFGVEPKEKVSLADLKYGSVKKNNKIFLEKKRLSHGEGNEESRNLIKKDVEHEDEIEPYVNENEKKLTFQLIKSDMNSKSFKRLKKNIYSVSDRHMSRSNNESVNPLPCNDRLYVTKRMLFYANKESSSTSKDSLNIAIRRDTEISNNGNSNNILNVVIKQTKNSVTNTKPVKSPKSDFQNQDSSNCDKKLCENLNTETDSVNINDSLNINRNKLLKEAECQTEDKPPEDDRREGCGDQALPHFYEQASNAIQDEFRNFFIYHFQNMKPITKKNYAYNKQHNKANVTKKQMSSERYRVSKNNDLSESFIRNSEPSTAKMLRGIHNNNSKPYTQEHYNPSESPFFTVVKNGNKNNLPNSKLDDYVSGDNFDVSTINKSDKKQDRKNEIEQNKEIVRPNLTISANQCHQTESENIALKLKNIGLSDKKSFVRVISSKSSTEIPLYTKLDCSKVCHTDQACDSLKKPHKRETNSLKKTKENIQNDLKKVIHSRQKEYFSPRIKRIQKNKSYKEPSVLLNQQNLNVDLISNEENKFLKIHNTQIKDTIMSNVNNSSRLKNENVDNFQTKMEEDYLKLKKDNFVAILPVSEGNKVVNKELKVQNREVASDKFEVAKKISQIVTRNFEISERGVQTETCHLASTAPYTSVSCLKKCLNTNYPNNNELNLKNTILFEEKKDLPLSNKFRVQVDSVDTLPKEKNSFVHIINSNIEESFVSGSSKKQYQFCTENKLEEKKTQVSSSETVPENIKNEKSIHIQKQSHEGQQIIYKINAVYEFLQYLDKMLKENSLLKLDTNVKSSCTLGQFNTTLRCLCDNCIEILNKIDVKQPVEKNKPVRNQRNKSDKNSIPRPVNNNSLFVKIVNEPKIQHSQKSNDSSVQYLNLSEFEDNYLIHNDLESDYHSGRKPFFVILSPDEKNSENSNEHSLNYSLNAESNEYPRLVDAFDYNSVKNQFHINFEDGCNDTFLNQKLVKCATSEKRLKYNETQGNIEIKDNTRDVYYTVQETYRKQIIGKTQNPKHEILHNKKNVKEMNTLLKQRDVINTSSKRGTDRLLDLQLSSEHCFEHGHNVNDQDSSSKSNCNLYSHSKTDLCRENTVNYKSILGSNCCKSNACHCCASKISSDLNLCNYETKDSSAEVTNFINSEYIDSERNDHQMLPENDHKTRQDDTDICTGCCNSQLLCCCRSSSKPVARDPKLRKYSLISHLTSKIPFRKDSRTGKKCISNEPELLNENVTLKYRTPSEQNIIEKTGSSRRNNTFKSQSNSTSIKNNRQCVQNTTIKEEDDSCEEYDTDTKNISDQQCIKRDRVLQDNTRKQIYTSKEFSSDFSLYSSDSQIDQRNSLVFVNTYLSMDEDINNHMNTEMSNVPQRNFENEIKRKDGAYDLEGWVSLNDNITEVEDNQIRVDMHLNNIPVQHVEYVQKFPENLANCTKKL